MSVLSMELIISPTKFWSYNQYTSKHHYIQNNVPSCLWQVPQKFHDKNKTQGPFSKCPPRKSYVSTPSLMSSGDGTRFWMGRQKFMGRTYWDVFWTLMPQIYKVTLHLFRKSFNYWTCMVDYRFPTVVVRFTTDYSETIMSWLQANFNQYQEPTQIDMRCHAVCFELCCVDHENVCINCMVCIDRIFGKLILALFCIDYFF